MQSITNVAKAKIELFVRLRHRQLEQFVHTAEAAGRPSGQSTATSPSLGKFAKASKAKPTTGRAAKNLPPWDCPTCTYRNEGAEADTRKCSMCETPPDKAGKHAPQEVSSAVKDSSCNHSDSSAVAMDVAEPSSKQACTHHDPENVVEGYPHLTEADHSELDEDLEKILKIAELDPRVQALLEMGDASDSSDSG